MRAVSPALCTGLLSLLSLSGGAPAVRAAAATAPVATAAARESDLASVAAEYTSVNAQLAPHFDGFQIRDERHAVDLLDRLWSLTAQWLALELDAHPRASADELVGTLHRLSPELEGEAIAVAGGFLVETHRGELGNVVLVLPGPHGHRIAWNVKDALRSWSAAGARTHCRDELADDDESDDCGPWLASHLGTLPDDAEGHPRFFVDASMPQYAGMTMFAELSIWSWDGRGASLLLLHGHDVQIDETPAPHLEGGELVVPGKGTLRTIFVSGASAVPHVEWRARVTPSGIEDLGERSLDGDLTLVDEILARLQRGQATDELAAPAAAHALAAAVADWDATPGDDGLRSGMLDHEPPHAGVDHWCLSVDGLGDFELRFAGSGAARTLVAARPTTCN